MNIWRVLPGAVLLLCALKAGITEGIPEHLDSSLVRQEQVCDYMKRDDTQKNAYTHGSGFCCFCPRGKYFVDDCNPFNPSSTQCKTCPPGTHIHFGPHLETECFKKYRRHCSSPKVYSGGNEEIPDGCVCPTSMYEDKVTGNCKKNNPAPPPFLPIKQPTEKTTTIGIISKSTNSPLNYPPTSINQETEDAISIMAKPLTNATPDSDADYASIVIAGVSGAAMVVIIVLLYKFLCKRRKTQASNILNSKSTITSDDSTDFTESTVSIDRPSDNASIGQVTTIGAEKVETVETPLLDDNSLLISSRDDTFLNPTETYDNEETIRKCASKIPQKDYESFALQLAETLQTVMRGLDVLPFFRRIHTGIEHLNKLEDLAKEHQYNTSELIYRCMTYMVTLKGTELSPLYIWEQFKRFGPKRYTEIVSNKIEVFATDHAEHQSKNVCSQV